MKQRPAHVSRRGCTAASSCMAHQRRRARLQPQPRSPTPPPACLVGDVLDGGVLGPLQHRRHVQLLAHQAVAAAVRLLLGGGQGRVGAIWWEGVGTTAGTRRVNRAAAVPGPCGMAPGRVAVMVHANAKRTSGTQHARTLGTHRTPAALARCPLPSSAPTCTSQPASVSSSCRSCRMMARSAAYWKAPCGEEGGQRAWGEAHEAGLCAMAMCAGALLQPCMQPPCLPHRWQPMNADTRAWMTRHASASRQPHAPSCQPAPARPHAQL